MRLCTFAFESPGRLDAKSTINSELECEMITRFEYRPCAVRSSISRSTDDF